MVSVKNGVNQDFWYFVSINEIWSVVKFEHVQTIPYLGRAARMAQKGILEPI